MPPPSALPESVEDLREASSNLAAFFSILLEWDAAGLRRWEGICTDENQIEISGPSASGKTTLTFIVVAALANPTGVPVRVLGREVTPLADGKYVVVLEEENAEYSVRAKLEDSCVMLGLPVRETIDRCILVIRRSTFVHPDTAETRECKTNQSQTTCESRPVYSTTMIAGPVDVFSTRGRLCAQNKDVVTSQTKNLSLKVSTPTAAPGAWGGHGTKSTTFRWAFE